MAGRYINAAKDGYLDVLQQATKRDLNTPDEDGMTAVMWAAHNGHLDALRLIVGRGGDAEKCDYVGLTPLHHAARKGLLHVVSYLVNWGTNLYALDNDHHTALDLASLYERSEVVQFLDQVYSQHQSKNPKHANRLKEDAIRHAERNVRRYEKLQEVAARRALKEQRRLTSGSQEGVKNGGGHSSGQGKNFIKSLTMAIRGSKSQGKGSAPGKTYSDIAGISHSTGARRGVAKRIQQRQAQELNGSVRDDFKISDLDETGRRTQRSLSDVDGVRGMSADVMYVSGQRSNSDAMLDVTYSRPAVYDVFGGQSNPVKGKSEFDSGVDSYFGDEDDEETAPGIFNRPGFGKTAFLTGSNFLNTLPSFEVDGDPDGKVSMNGYSLHVNGKDGTSEGSADKTVGEGSWADARELPWDQDEVDNLDDDEDGMTTSALEMFLWSAGLEAYLHKFLQEKVDMEILVKMSDSELKEIGLPFGPRKRLLEAIQRRKDVLSLPKYMSDSFL